MSDQAFLYDSTKCISCHACEIACKQWNGLPVADAEKSFVSADNWLKIKSFHFQQNSQVDFFSSINMCFHCEDAQCLKVCPQKAIVKKNDWVVIQDDLCIGCGLCVEACSFNVISLLSKNVSGLSKGKAYKCDACQLSGRSKPACVVACPTKALSIGYRPKILAEAEKRFLQVKLTNPQAAIYGLREYRGLRVISILKRRPEFYGLPVANKNVKVADVEELHGVYKLLAILTSGFPFLKKQCFNVACLLTGKGNRKNIRRNV